MRNRKILSVFILSAMLASLSACGSKKNDDKKSSSETVISSNEIMESTIDLSSSEESKPVFENSVDTINELSNSIEKDANLVDGMRPEFKEALDSYETFFDEYCEILKKYNESPDDMSILSDYTKYMSKYSETMEKMDKLDDGEMNDAELKYYLEVTMRINEKLSSTG